MSDPRRDLDDLVTRLHDGLLADDQREQVLQQAESDADLAAALDRDRELDAALRGAFAPPPAVMPVLPDLTQLEEPLPGDSLPSDEAPDVAPAAPTSEPRRLVWYALAASVVWAVFGWQWLGDRRGREVAYVERPLAEVYQTSVDEGFQPYWVCDDDEVFAETFRRRQGVPLELRDLPEGRVMTGLSYLGGLSPGSTSMLARVDGQPVIVVIDRIENDWGPPVGRDEVTGVNVFREERAGLVLYEVSPLDEPALLGYFQPLSSTSGDPSAP